jgi:uncharacterized protein YkwD
MTASSGVTVAVALAAIFWQTQATLAGPSTNAIEELIAVKINAYRKQEGVAPIVPEERLQAAARSLASFMARTGTYGHEANGLTPAQRVSQAGYEVCIVRENIARLELSRVPPAADIAGRLVSGWIGSKGHRNNLMAEHVTQFGVGVAAATVDDLPTSRYRYYAVQVFARPMTEAYRFTVRNTQAETVSYTVDGKYFDLPPNSLREHLQCTRPVLEATAGGERRVYKPRSGATIDL